MMTMITIIIIIFMMMIGGLCYHVDIKTAIVTISSALKRTTKISLVLKNIKF